MNSIQKRLIHVVTISASKQTPVELAPLKRGNSLAIPNFFSENSKYAIGNPSGGQCPVTVATGTPETRPGRPEIWTTPSSRMLGTSASKS